MQPRSLCGCRPQAGTPPAGQNAAKGHDIVPGTRKGAKVRKETGIVFHVDDRAVDEELRSSHGARHGNECGDGILQPVVGDNRQKEQNAQASDDAGAVKEAAHA